jgi:hypothetical protein
LIILGFQGILIPVIDLRQADWRGGMEPSRQPKRFGGIKGAGGGRMMDDLDRKGNNLLVGILIGATIVAIGVLGYLYYDRVTQKPVVKIDVPGFSGEITKDKGGIDIEVGKDR